MCLLSGVEQYVCLLSGSKRVVSLAGRCGLVRARALVTAAPCPHSVLKGKRRGARGVTGTVAGVRYARNKSDNNITLPERLRRRRVQRFSTRRFPQTFIHSYLELDLVDQSNIHAFLTNFVLVGQVIAYVGDLESGFEHVLCFAVASVWLSPQGGPLQRQMRELTTRMVLARLVLRARRVHAAALGRGQGETSA